MGAGRSLWVGGATHEGRWAQATHNWFIQRLLAICSIHVAKDDIGGLIHCNYAHAHTHRHTHTQSVEGSKRNRMVLAQVAHKYVCMFVCAYLEMILLLTITVINQSIIHITFHPVDTGAE